MMPIGSRHRGPFVVVMTFAISISGCGSPPPRGEVEGTVRRHGQPLANVLVTFVPDPESGTNGARSAAVTDGQGRYRLQGEDQKPGVVAGSHRVIIEDLAVYSAPRDRDGTVSRLPLARFSSRYSHSLQTPLRKQVRDGAQVIDLDLTDIP